MKIYKSSHLDIDERTMLGSFYTPEKITKLVVDYVKPLINKETIIIDTSAGTGAFIKEVSSITENFIAADIDVNAVKYLKNSYGSKRVFLKNALDNVKRSKYDLSQENEIIIIGNPPYNDFTSQSKQEIKMNNLKPNIDEDIRARDLGISFLKSYNKLNANYIAVLHPLSYLIKKGNFRLLKPFTSNYKLVRGTIISSGLFPDTGSTKFPILVSLYKRDKRGMTYQDVEKFKFQIFNSEKSFSLGQLISTDPYIRKYTPTKSMTKVSNIGVYFYEYRDINSLFRSQTFTKNKKWRSGNIPVMLEELYKYCYLDVFKEMFFNDYLTGNLSPLMPVNQLSKNSLFTKKCLVWALNNNRNLINRLNEEAKLNEVITFYSLSELIDKDFSKDLKNEMEKIRKGIF